MDPLEQPQPTPVETVQQALERIHLAEQISQEYREMADKRIAALISPEIKAEIAEIEAIRDEALADQQHTIEQNVALVKQTLVEKIKDTVNSEHLQAVYTPGKVSYDAQALKGYAAAHPDLLTLQKTGDPSVSIRKVRSK